MGKKHRKRERRKRNESRARRQALLDREFSGQPSPLVERTLLGWANPIVALSGVVHGGVYRGIGAIIQRWDDGLRLVVTCRHVVHQMQQSSAHPIACITQPRTLQFDLLEFIEDPDLRTDIAFVLVRDKRDSATEPLVIQSEDPELKSLKVMYNARNTSMPAHGSFRVDILRQAVSEMPEVLFVGSPDASGALSNALVARNDARRVEELASKGWLQCRAFQMISRQGNSGSPIFDDELRLYGLDAVGTSRGHGEGDMTGCIPVSELFHARERVEDLVRAALSRAGA